MNTRTIIEVFTTSAELDIEQIALFIRFRDEESIGVGSLESSQALNIDYGGDADDPNYIVIDPVETIAAVIDEPGALPEPKMLYNYTNKDIGVEVEGVTFRELVRAVLVALDGDYNRILY